MGEATESASQELTETDVGENNTTAIKELATPCEISSGRRAGAQSARPTSKHKSSPHLTINQL